MNKRRSFRKASTRAGKVKRRRAWLGDWGRASLIGGVAACMLAGGVVIAQTGRLPAFIHAVPASVSGDVCRQLSVHDGDTIRCGAERIRIENIDAPELVGSPKCEGYRRSYAWCDFAKGYAARDALKAFLSRGQVRVERHGLDKYGRTLARISVNGNDAGDFLVSEGLARPWR